MTNGILVLRARPLSLSKHGPPRPRLEQIAREIDNRRSEQPEPDVETFDLPIHYKNWSEDLLGQRLERGFMENRTVVFDFSWDLDESSWGHADIFVKNVLRAAAGGLRKDSRIAVLLDRKFDDAEAVPTLQREAPWNSRLMIADTTDGGFILPPSTNWAPGRALGKCLKLDLEDIRLQVASRVVRRRGAFSERMVEKPHLYRYSAENCADELSILTRRYLSREAPALVVYDSEGEAWFQTMVRNCAFALKIPHAGSASLAKVSSSRGRRDKEAMITQMSDKKIVVVLPMLKAGNRAARIRGHIEEFEGRPQLLAVLARELNRPRHMDGYLRSNREIGGAQMNVDYFVPVEHRQDASNDWLIEAARANESHVDDPLADWSRPSHLGMWSLLAHLGTEPEEPLPRPRPRILHFPRLRKLSKKDALWLAESLVRVAERAGGQVEKRTRLFVVVPDDPSGSRHISEAMRKHLDVAVVRVPRNVIEGDVPMSEEMERDLQTNVNRRIVVIDESAVTYGTINRLVALVTNKAKQPDLALVVVESRSERWAEARPSGFQAFYQLAPHAFIEEVQPAGVTT